ncbi:MAG: antibiotic biosynthesis monooxygenase [Chloroflexi bacterium]|nr:antibiotic biosynthesis monooxygenase [Chloroflexota bacterium]MBU1751730.1 antibiotic biosynthesis monooxygenase [Chloroflexota bacterium]
MSVLSTAIYTVASEEEAQRFADMAEGMTRSYEAQPGFQRLIVARAVNEPLTLVTISWWETEDALRAWTTNSSYRQAKDDAGGRGMKAKMEFGRWVPVDRK